MSKVTSVPPQHGGGSAASLTIHGLRLLPLPAPTPNTQSLFALIEVLLQNFNGTAGVR